MPATPTPLRLKELLPDDVSEVLRRDPRLLIPVGTCEPHGPHLPLGCDTLVVEHLVDELSAELQILRAPTIEYGVNTPQDRPTPGGSGLRRKTLLRSLNDLIESWEAGGIREFVLVTAHGQEGHVEALSTVITKGARVQVVDILSIPLHELGPRSGGVLHGDEVDTSLVLYLFPELVRMSRATDYVPSGAVSRRASLKVPAASSGSVGRPTSATSVKGEAIYKRIKQLVRDRVLMAPPEPTE